MEHLPQYLCAPPASPSPVTQGELGMILKSIDIHLKELPKLELGDIATRATRLTTWKIQVEQMMTPAGPHLKAWWKWIVQKAMIAYGAFMKANIHVRESIIPLDSLPTVWEQIDSWIKPRLLAAVPKDINDWVFQRARQGVTDDSHVVLFYIMKKFAPGGADEKIHLNNSILNPQVCSQAKAAQITLIKWKEDVRRSEELGCFPPDILMSYRAMESIINW